MAFTNFLPEGHTFVACRKLIDDSLVDLYAAAAPIGTDYQYKKLDARTYEAQLVHIMDMLVFLWEDSGLVATEALAKAVIYPMYGETFETWKTKLNGFFDDLYTAYLI